jgi:hypothetical protein
MSYWLQICSAKQDRSIEFAVIGYSPEAQELCPGPHRLSAALSGCEFDQMCVTTPSFAKDFQANVLSINVSGRESWQLIPSSVLSKCFDVYFVKNVLRQSEGTTVSLVVCLPVGV